LKREDVFTSVVRSGVRSLSFFFFPFLLCFFFDFFLFFDILPFLPLSLSTAWNQNFLSFFLSLFLSFFLYFTFDCLLIVCVPACVSLSFSLNRPNPPPFQDVCKSVGLHCLVSLYCFPSPSSPSCGHDKILQF